MSSIPRQTSLGMSELNSNNGKDCDKDAKADTDVKEVSDGKELDEEGYPSFKIVLPTVLCLYMTVFLVSIDRTIIGVAIPAISNEFKSFGDISWYETAFLLALCVCQLPMGKIFKYFSAKWTLAVLVGIFTVGTVLCAAAPTSNAFIVGRAISGIGAAGCTVGAQVILVEILPLRKRPKYQGAFGAVFGISSIIGPLAGGALTSKASWRACFYFSIPIAAVALAGLVFVLPSNPPPNKLEGTPFEKFMKFDPIGNCLVAPGLTLLLLALQWGGILYPWKSPRVVALLVVGCILCVAFVCSQIYLGENGTIPPRIIKQRSITASTIVSICLGAPLIITSFYIPIYFQAIKGTTAAEAGKRLLPYFLSTVIFVIASGILISKFGRYMPFLIIGCAILVVGCGLLSTLNVTSGIGMWLGYQIVYGAGTGASLQQTLIAVQTVLSKEDIPTGTTILAFAHFFGGSVFVAIAQTVLANTLTTKLATSLPGFDASQIAKVGATEIRNLVPPEDLPVVLEAYSKGINNVFYVALACAGLALIASCFMENLSVLTKEDKKTDSEPAAEQV